MSVRQCPDCELLFVSDTELRDHLDTEHPGRIGERLPHPGAHADPPPADRPPAAT